MRGMAVADRIRDVGYHMTTPSQPRNVGPREASRASRRLLFVCFSEYCKVLYSPVSSVPVTFCIVLFVSYGSPHHVYKSRFSMLGMYHLFSVLESYRLILAQSSARILHTADHRLLLTLVSASPSSTLALPSPELLSSIYVFPLGQHL